ncbi:MAG: DUF1818 family protein [Microcoleaceae cyanobacterium]
MTSSGSNQSRILDSGLGWRIGWNPQAKKFKGLVGTDDWAIELTEVELDDFCRLLEQLSKTMSHMVAELMHEEKITCEAETDQLWMQAEGYPTDYGLQFMLKQGRRAEGCWSSQVVPELLRAAQIQMAQKKM